MKKIKIGYEVKTGKEISIAPSHLVVTGITQESGKTTTLESLIKRGKSKAIIFKTKHGERGITQGTKIMPFFKEEFDWEYAVEILEASRKEKLKFERSWIIKYSKTANNLIEFKANLDQAIARDVSGEKKLRELEKSILISLQAYLEKILPELQYSPLSSELDMNDGINIMDLERLKEETQSLIIKSVLDEILRNYKNIVVVIPEAWKYLPQRFGNPVKRPAEKYIRQGATNCNYLWIDSQDITGVEKTILKQVSTWILGYQREINEIQRTLDQIPLPKKQKPKAEDIASLDLGHFYVATKEFTKKVYVQPAWLSDKIAKEIALGNKNVYTVNAPSKKDIKQLEIEPLPSFDKQKESKPIPISNNEIQDIKNQVDELRNDVVARVKELNMGIKDLYQKISNIPQSTVNETAIINRIMQKIPISSNQPASFDKESLIQEVLSRIPAGSQQVYEVSPLEKIKKDFLIEAKNRIINIVKNLDEEQKKILKFIESQGQGTNLSKVLDKCLHVSMTSGGTRTRVRDKIKDLQSKELLRVDKNTVSYPSIKQTLISHLGTHEASADEIKQVYNHILNEMI